MMGLKKYILEKFLIILGIINIVYFIVCFLTFKMIVNFSGFFALLGGLLIILGILSMRYMKIYNNNPIMKVLKTSIILIFLVFVIIQGCIIYSAAKVIKDKPDYIMILGGGIRGRNMLLIQLQRTEKALEFIKKNPDVKIIVSGGQGKGEDISEAESMREYLVGHGVDNNNIIKEEKSTNTMENMKYTKNILKAIDNRDDLKIGIVTSNFHVFRAKFLAKRAGLNGEGIAAPSNELLLPNFTVRESFAVIKSFFIDR